MNTVSPRWQKNAVFGAVAEVTGYALSDLSREQSLESDLGLDSIKTIELMNAIVPHLPAHLRDRFQQSLVSGNLFTVQSLGELEDCIAQLDPHYHDAGPIETDLSMAGGDSLTTQVFAIVAGVTGHHVEELTAELFLESDLGLDSIKTVELMNALSQVIPAQHQSEFMEKLSNGALFAVQTLGELLVLMASDSEAAVHVPATLATAEQGVQASATHTVDIVDAQYPFLVAHSAISPCSLSSGLRLQGPFSTEYARLAWDGLLSRHPMLRARLVIPDDALSFKDYSLEVLDAVTAPALEVKDLRALDSAAQEAFLAEAINRFLNQEWSLQLWPVHGFSVFRLADDIHEVVFANHHVFADGLSNQQIMREFITLYAAIATGQPAELAPTTTVADYQQMVARINAWSDTDADKALEQFLRRQGKSRFFWDPEHKGITKHSRADSRSYRFAASAKSTSILLQAAGRWRLPVNTLLVGAYLRAISRFAGDQQQLVLNIPTSGRLYPEVDATQTIGCFAQNLALTLPLPATELSWREYLPRVHENIEEALAHGYDRAQTRQAALASTSQLPLQNGHIGEPHASFIRASVKSNLYLPYIGQTRIEASYGPLRILDYYAATCTNPGTVDVLVEVFQGRFKMAANYDAAYFSSELMQALTDEFIQQIDDLAQASLALEEQSNTKAEGVVSAVAEQLLDIAEQVLRRKLDVASLQLDLESDLGMDSLERIRLVGRLRQALPTVDTRALLGCRRLSEMAELIRPASEPAKSLPAIPYLHIAARCHQHPDAIAVQDGEISLSYGQLNLQANQLAHYLRSLGIGPGQLVGLMLPRSAEFAIAVLAVLKAGAAYVPIDPGYPGARIGYMVSHSRISVLITLQTLLPILAELNQPLHQILLMDRLQSQYRGEQQYLGCDVWLNQPAYDPECVNNPDDLMVVLYTSGSTGTPKGVALAHRGYMNRMDWHQDLFCLEVGERVAQKTSICFDISVWELLWPLLNGGIICPVAQDLLRDPWQLADWIESEHIAVMHFVPSLFNEFLLALAGSQHRFESLRWLIFSGEALPVSLVQNWFDQRGKHVALANLYGPTEASIDVTAHLMHSRPVQGTLRIPIGPAMPDVHIVILDEAMQLLPDGQVGELWIGGIQLAQGYLYDADRTAENFRANPFPEIPGAYLYRTGDLAVRLADGSFDYRGRIDNQIKIRGFRVELGEIEAAIDAISGITENAVLAQDMGEGNLRLVAWLSGNELPLAELRTILAQRLPEYMLPQQVFHADALPKNHNGKLDRNALKQWTAAGHAPEISQAPTSSAAMLGPAQAWMTHYFEPPYDWKGYTRHRYLQPLDIEVFQQALNLIAERHPVLRTLFIETQGRLQPIAAPDHAPLTVDVYDVAHLDGNGREQEIRRLVTETLAQLHPEQFPLLRVLVMKTSAADCCEIAVVGHHLISDLVSNNILFREVWQLYGLLATKQAPQLGAAPPSFRAYTDELHSVKTQAARQSYIDYWCGQFQDPQRRLQIPCEHQLGCNEESSSAVERLVLPRQVFQNISDVRKHFQSSLYPLLLAPAYRLLGEWCQQQWVTLSHRSHGRDFGDGRTFFDSVGNFAVNYPVTVELSAAESWRTLVTKITQAFAEVPLNGVSYDLVGGDLPEALYPDEKLTPVRINYLGNRSLPKSDIFAFDEEEWDRRYAAPQQRRTALIEIFLSTVNGQLRIDIDYSRHFFTAASMQRLGQRYLELLTELIESVHNQPTLRLVSVRQPTAGDTPMESAYQGPSAAPAGRHRVALVTGASRGIGRAIALKLSREGAIVALTARSRAGLEVVAKEITDAGGIALVVPADITDAGQVQAVVDDILSRFGQLDVLVNNAGITGLSALASSDSETWKRVIEVNLFGTYHLCRAVTPQMMKQRSGKIINLGSDSSFIGYPLFSAYAASKHGLIGMTRSLAEELKPHNIQVNAVCPAFVDTDMTPTAFRAHAIPTDAVADAVAFLASAQAQWITGESVKLYGRQDMYWFGADKMGGLEAMMGVAKVARAQEERHG